MVLVVWSMGVPPNDKNGCVLSSALSVINVNNHPQNGMFLCKKCADAPALATPLRAWVGLSTDASPVVGLIRPCLLDWLALG